MQEGFQNQLQQVQSQLEKFDISTLDLPKRQSAAPPQGSQQVQLLTNFFRFKTLQQNPVRIYSLDFEPPIERNSRKLIGSLVNKVRQPLEEKIGRFICKGQNLFAEGKPEVSELLNFQVQDQEGIPYTLSVKSTKRVIDCNVKNLDAMTIQYLNIVWKETLRKLKLKEAGRIAKYFDSEQQINLPKYRMNIWPGYQTSVQQLDGGVFLQVDLLHRILRMDTVLDHINNLSQQYNQQQLQRAIAEDLIGRSVLANYGNNQMYQITDIKFDASPKSTFQKGNATVSYVQYFQEAYGQKGKITNFNQPLLVSQSSRSKQEIHLIPELCLMIGLTDEMRQDFRLMKDLAIYTRVDPGPKLERSKNLVTKVKQNPEAKEVLTRRGIEIDQNPTQVNGYVVPPQTIQLGGGQKLQNIANNFQLRSTILKPETLDVWVYVYTTRDQQLAERLLDELRQQAQQYGVNMGEPERCVLDVSPSNSEQIVKTISQHFRPPAQGQKGTQFMLFLQPDNFKKFNVYQKIKQTCTMKFPIPTQVVCTKTVMDQKKFKAVCGKILLQMNCKVGGSLWSIPKEPSIGQSYNYTMVCGIDVTHDTVNRKVSILGFVASIDPNFTQYYSTIQVQDVGQEISAKIQSCMLGALQAFHQKAGRLPQLIIVYRDGVGLSQVALLKQNEIKQIKEAFSSPNCTKANGNQPYNPNFIFCMVNKRISSRFMSLDQGVLVNPRPGTIINNYVTSQYCDFYLIPQQVTQGTATPTHFWVLENTTNPAVQQSAFEVFTYKLCLMYFNWAGPVRVPAPVMYAHKLAFFGGQVIHAFPHQNLATKLYYL